MTNKTVSLYQGTGTPGSGLVVGEVGGTQVSQVRNIQFTGAGIASITNPVGGQALITITTSATGAAAFILFRSSAIPSSGQTFTDPNIGAYNNQAQLMILSVNGVILTPLVSYTVSGNTVTILDWLDPVSIVQIEPTPGDTSLRQGFNYDVIPLFIPTAQVTTSAGIMGVNSFTVAGDQRGIFATNLSVAFQNTRANGQQYLISTASYDTPSNTTTVSFTPGLLAADVFAIGSAIYLVTGTFSQTFVTDLAVGLGFNASVSNGLLTLSNNLDNKINYDTIPIFTNSNFQTIGPGLEGATSFSTIGNGVPIFAPQTRITFQNNRNNGQVYVVSTSSYTGSNTNVVFSPPLLEADFFTANSPIYTVVGTFTETEFTDVALGEGLRGGVVNSLLTIENIPTINSINYDTAPTFIASSYVTIGIGSAASNSFSVLGDATGVFVVGAKVAFQNLRVNGQIYTVSAMPVFSGGITTVIFSPGLLAIDAYPAASVVYRVSGDFTVTPFTDLVTGANITSVISNGFLSLSVPINIALSGGNTGLTVGGTPINTGTGTFTLGGTVNVASGGTGLTSLQSNSVLLGNGTNALQAVPPGPSGNVLTSNGTSWTSSTLNTGLTIASQGEMSVNTINTYTIDATKGTLFFVYFGNGEGGRNNLFSNVEWGVSNTAGTLSELRVWFSGGVDFQVSESGSILVAVPANTGASLSLRVNANGVGNYGSPGTARYTIVQF